ncbi:hypothetical protein BYZ73_11515 [Rhodovulum viride]|uniref:Transposase IS4-like domain-containing protein n=1 Tax=Rhodovulum viride TaxID=1231134 RepID=A0ABX9DID9_9RHOB|nr:hypothetical protein BYZ73_11515 [Rhodovulum viride]
MPDHSPPCRRQARIAVQSPYRRSGTPLNLLIDSTGIRFRGDGEWLSRKHGATRRREWRKVHLAMDTANGDIRAVEFTSRRHGDSPVPPEPLSQIPAGEESATVTAGGAYDTRRSHPRGKVGFPCSPFAAPGKRQFGLPRPTREQLP